MFSGLLQLYFTYSVCYALFPSLAIARASYQADPDRATIAPDCGGVETVLHAALGDDSFCEFLQSKAAEAGVDMRKISLPPAAGSTGVCMVLSGWTDVAKSKSDRCFLTHYGVVGYDFKYKFIILNTKISILNTEFII